MAHSKMQLTDWLDDLSVRFIVNLPREELESVERICFQVEEAQWFYEDFVRPLDPKLPSLNLRQFSMKIFQHCPLFSSYDAEVHSRAFSEFLAYKTRVPVRGAILLNEAMDEVILVKGWKKGANWSFPRGKINKDEKDIHCAIREVYEETGYDIRAAGLVGDEDNAKFIEVTMREQHMKLFVFAGIPMDTHFEPRTRKEISKIQWYKLSELPTLKKMKQQQQNPGAQDIMNHPNKFYMVAPFLNPLKKIITTLRKERAIASAMPLAAVPMHESPPPPEILQRTPQSDPPVAEDMARLMAKLRESKQAHRESNLPEVTDLTDATSNASINLKTLLNLPVMAHSTPSGQKDDAREREQKANAMLSLLRAGKASSNAPSGQFDAPPLIPHERILGQISQTPPSPVPRTVRSPQGTEHVLPPAFQYTPKMYNHLNVGPGPLETFDSRGSLVNAQAMQHSSNRAQPLPRTSYSQPQAPPRTAQAPYQRTGDPDFAKTSQFPGTGGSVIPPASKLPPPKLNQHSSALLNLFKSERSPASTSAPASASLTPADKSTNVERPELAVVTPTVLQRPPPFSSVVQGVPQMLSSTSALVMPTAHSQQGESNRRPSQQETLLNLFRQAKPSPSLLPAEDPVELAAQGSPTYSRTPPDPLGRYDSGHKEQLLNGHAKLQQRSRKVVGNPTTPASATVTGPLNVPQFEKILRRPRDNDPGTSSTVLHDQHTPLIVPQPIKILSRPSTANTTSNSTTQGSRSIKRQSPKPSRSPQTQQNTASKVTASSFQPQILKRPSVVTAVPEHNGSENNSVFDKASSRTSHNSAAPLPIRHAPILDRRLNQNEEQKAALLDLFTTPNNNFFSTPQMPARTGSVVSPLTEKPSMESGFPSPVSLARPKQESSTERGFSTGAATVPPRSTHVGTANASSIANPGDKQFLLGFLNGVVKEGRK